MRRATSRICRFRQVHKFISIHALREESDRIILMSISMEFIFQSTLSVRRATYLNAILQTQAKFQSTLSVRRATIYQKRDYRLHMISIHALREESDLTLLLMSVFSKEFQSTLSVRRATWYCKFIDCCSWHFNPRSPWGERQSIWLPARAYRSISIHALREESDTVISLLLLASKISIHALREESDSVFPA